MVKGQVFNDYFKCFEHAFLDRDKTVEFVISCLEKK